MSEDDRTVPLLVLGLGNVLCGDDGLGVVAAQELLRRYELPDGVVVLDGGTLGLSLLPHLENLDSAAAAAKRSVELKPDYFNYFILAQILFKMKNYPEALPAAEKALELAKPMAAKYEGFTTMQYENLIKQIKEAMAKEPGGEVKK